MLDSLLALFGGMPAKEPTVSPRKWGREEVDYLTKIGAMHNIQRDPMARQGYQWLQNPDGSGLVMDGSVRYPQALGEYLPWSDRSPGKMSVRTNQDPERYGLTLTHELGHAGSDKTAPIKSANDEEIRQYLTDYFLAPQKSRAAADARTVMTREFGLDPQTFTAGAAKKWLPYVDVQKDWGYVFPKKAAK